MQPSTLSAFVLAPPPLLPTAVVPLSPTSAPRSLRHSPRRRLRAVPAATPTRFIVSCAAPSASSEPRDDDDAAQPDASASMGADDATASDTALPALRSLFSAAGDPDCEQCEGAGTIVCPLCEGTGSFSITVMDVTSATTCRLCRGARRVPCPSCRTEVYKAVLWWDQVPRDEDGNEPGDEDLPEGRFRWGRPPTEPMA